MSNGCQTELKIVSTGDGSNSLYLPEQNEHYHSKYGALQEAKHVFIEHGWTWLKNRFKPPFHILEVGFGTGLNALLTLRATQQAEKTVHYTALEPHPLPLETVRALRYPDLLEDPGTGKQNLEELHQSTWDQEHPITPHFTFKKRRQKLQSSQFSNPFHLIYYDTFAPRVQPALWSYPLLAKTAHLLLPGGGWVSYCAKGSVKRHLKKAGLQVESLPGPPGKREITRAKKVKNQLLEQNQ